MRLLVTGATGFVGSSVVRAALGRGHEVMAVVRSRARGVALGDVPGLRVVEADLNDGEAMRRVAAGASADVALHLAWAIGPDYFDSPRSLVCVEGSLALLRGLLDARCPRVVFVGTHLELAPSDRDMNEGSPVAPRGLYAACKDALRRIADARLALTDTSFAWPRLFNLYGPGQPEWAFVSSVVRHLLEGRRCPLTHGEQQRAFLHVRDAADALLAVCESSVRGVVHVGSDDVVTVRGLAERIGADLHRAELLAFGALAPSAGDAPRVVASTTRLRETTGFAARVSLDEGLRETIDWWRTQTQGAA